MARKVYYSFYYKQDKLRIQQVLQMGRLEGQRILTGQNWEEVEKGGAQFLGGSRRGHADRKSVV